MTPETPAQPPAAPEALTKDDLCVLRRLAEAKRADLRRKPDTTADVLWAYDDLIGKLRRGAVTPPAAPESDVSALTDLLAAATPGPWQHFGDHLVWPSERGPAANDPIAGVSEEHQECAALIVAAVNALPALLADLTAARERVRVVEGERDAAVASGTDLARALHATNARAESAEAAHEALRKGIEALDRSGRMRFDHSDLRALLAGGAS